MPPKAVRATPLHMKGEIKKRDISPKRKVGPRTKGGHANQFIPNVRSEEARQELQENTQRKAEEKEKRISQIKYTDPANTRLYRYKNATQDYNKWKDDILFEAHLRNTEKLPLAHSRSKVENIAVAMNAATPSIPISLMQRLTERRRPELLHNERGLFAKHKDVRPFFENADDRNERGHHHPRVGIITHKRYMHENEEDPGDLLYY